MTPYEAILGKRDTRAFEARPIPEETLHRIVQAGRMAGSAKALEPVRFVVIESQAQKEALARCGGFTPHLPTAAVVVALVLEPEMGVVGAPLTHFRGPFDAGRAAQNMMIAAWAEGIASCPASMHHAAEAAKVLGLPEGYTVANTIAFGYPAGTDAVRPNRPRRPLEEYVHRERW
ncbi:MAG: nitroreductase family protein [Dehalococcoidia bacterium]|nr:nitroreductase family protein [Dehalococcoidia bacterium]